MKKIKLKVSKRTVLGRKVKSLRRKGILPANIYGKKIKSKPVQVGIDSFQRLYRKVGETTIINLNIGEERIERPALITNVQYDPVSGVPLHADFHQVSLKEKVEASIPLRLVGSAPAVEQKVGTILTLAAQIEIKALPGNLPDYVEVDISKLEKLDQEIKVKDLKIDTKEFEVLTEQELVIVKIGPMVTKEAKKLAKEEEEAREAAKEEARMEGEKEEAEKEKEEETREEKEVAKEEKGQEKKS